MPSPPKATAQHSLTTSGSSDLSQSAGRLRSLPLSLRRSLPLRRLASVRRCYCAPELVRALAVCAMSSVATAARSTASERATQTASCSVGSDLSFIALCSRTRDQSSPSAGQPASLAPSGRTDARALLTCAQWNLPHAQVGGQRAGPKLAHPPRGRGKSEPKRKRATKTHCCPQQWCALVALVRCDLHRAHLWPLANLSIARPIDCFE